MIVVVLWVGCGMGVVEVVDVVFVVGFLVLVMVDVDYVVLVFVVECVGYVVE